MRLGVVMLVHEHLDRAASVANALILQGAALVIHADRRTDPKAVFALRANCPDAHVIATCAADWGRFGMIDATLEAVQILLRDAPDVTHVALISGTCLPIQPLTALERHIDASPDTDFIESVPVQTDAWVKDGLSLERFTLYHPVSYRRHKWLFDRSVSIQRMLKISRRLPPGLVPHLGAQWWCLRHATLRAILDHPDLRRWKSFFRLTWIPDEAFFQTLVRVVSTAKPGPSLHLSDFDQHGRPHVFHDDHIDILQQSDRFFARKIDPDATGLYKSFLPVQPAGERRPVGTRDFDAITISAATEGRGTFGQARYPAGLTRIAVDTMKPYCVVVHAGSQGAAPQMQENDVAWCGRLFGPSAVRFGDGQPSDVGPGNLPSAPLLRDYRPAQYLARLVFALGKQRLAFAYAPGDNRFIDAQVAGDGQARLVFVTDPAQAERLLYDLCWAQPKQRRASPVWAWLRVEAPGPDLSGRLAAIAQSDWSDPAGWYQTKGDFPVSWAEGAQGPLRPVAPQPRRARG